MTARELIAYAKLYNVSLTSEQAGLLIENMCLVLDYNKKINLTAITDEDEFVDKHLIDSLMCDLNHEISSLNVIDIGTGGGFPGIPLAIRYPMHRFTLLDSTAKKLRAVQMIAERLDLQNVTFLEGRAEFFAHERAYREKYDVVVSRGVAAYPVLLELCVPFLKAGGTFLAWKGQNYEQELIAAGDALKILKSTVRSTKKELLLKTDCFRVIIDTEKIGTIADRYPRSYGAIKKNPL